MSVLLKKVSMKHVLLHVQWWLLYGLVMSLVNIWGRPLYYTFGFMAICLLMAVIFYSLLGVYWHVQAAYRLPLYIGVMIIMQWLLFILMDKGLPRFGITLTKLDGERHIGKFLLFGLNIFFDIVLAVIAYIKHVKTIRSLEKQIQLERELHVTALERVQVKNEMLERELQMRKSESARWVTTMNAHAVGNAYNAIYKLLLKNEKVADGFLGLKAMYDYVLENAPGQSGMVSLQREIAMLDVWTRVFKLGYDSAMVDIEVAPGVPKITIPSFTYVVFVENAFEHGYHVDSNHPIRIRIEHDQQSVRYTISNKKNPNIKRNRLKTNRPSSLGIAGARHRLELADIPFDLIIDDTAGIYSVTLSIYTKSI